VKISQKWAKKIGYLQKNTHFPIKNTHFPIKNTHFRIKNTHFPIKKHHFPIKNRPQTAQKHSGGANSVFKAVNKAQIMKIQKNSFLGCVIFGKIVRNSGNSD
jgi:hypothetical protein